MSNRNKDVSGDLGWSLASVAVAVPVSLLVLLGLICAVYWAGLDGGFIFDDNQNIVSNPALRVTSLALSDWLSATFSTTTGPLQRPLAMLSFAINYYFTGLDPRAMKLTNLAIHLTNTLLVFGLCRSIFSGLAPQRDRDSGQSNWAALFVAASWALHPINLTAVLYIVQRMESLSHAFVFLGLWLYVLGRKRQLAGLQGWPLILAGIVMGSSLGILSKESAALLPLYAFFLELCLFKFAMPGRQGKFGGLSALYLCVLVLPGLVAAYWLLPRVMSPTEYYASREFSMLERLLTEPRVVMEYLRWMVLPDLKQLSLYHDDFPVSHGLFQPLTTFFAIIATLALLITAWKSRHRRPITAIGIFWFFSAHVLTATVFPLELMFEHRNYFASLGACLVFADVLILAPSPRFRRSGAILGTVFVLFCAGLTHLRAEEWNHPLRFAMTEVAKHPQSPRATYDLARNLVGLSRYNADSRYVPDAWIALERARAAPGSSILPHQAALIFAARSGVHQDRLWWQDMQAKLRTQTFNASNIVALDNLSDCAVDELCDFAREDIVDTFAAALHRGPQPAVLSVFGKYALYVLHDPQFALHLWQEAADGEPGNAQFQINLAMLQIDLNQFEKAPVAIANLRKLGRFGQYEGIESQLERNLSARKIRLPGTKDPMRRSR